MSSTDNINQTNLKNFSDDSVSHVSLTYWQLIKRRMLANRYGMFGFYLAVFVIFIGCFHVFLAPYHPNSKSNKQYYPPQTINWLYSDGEFHLRPYVYGLAEEMDPATFEFSYKDNPKEKFPISFFSEGDQWSYLGLKGNTRLFSVDTSKGHYMHLVGTDNLGRDVLSRMLAGATTTLLMAFIVVMCSAGIGLTVGLCAGYFSGNFDLVTQRLTEFIQSFPDLPLYLALLALLPVRANATFVFFMFAGILILLRWAPFSREIRGIVLSLRGMDYVKAAQAVGASRKRIIVRHIMPNTVTQLIVWVTFTFPEIILLETFLSFLGIGLQQPQISWGVMLNQILDHQTFNAAPWMMAPVVMIMISVLAFNAFGDGLRDAVDPYADN